jgi:hypothetical protein
MRRLGLIAFVLAFAPAVGCAHPFLRADPPVQSRGVTVGLVDQQCDRMIDPNWSYADILGLDVRIRVVNASAGDVALDPKKVRLLADGEARAPHDADSRRTILSGTTATFRVHFLERDENLACNVPMALSVAGAVATGSTVLSFAPLQFLVSTEDI